MPKEKEKSFQFELSKTQLSFVMSTAVVVVIVGGMGEGKTFSSIIGMLNHAKRNGRPIHCAIIRDTLENIKLSTAKSIQQELGTLARFKNDFRELTIYSKPRVTCDLFGIDDPASLSKLQGPEYALIWLEEPAPMADRANAGLSEEVFNVSLARCARQKDCIPRLQITMNPADEDHWTFKRLIEPSEIDSENPLITKEVFNIPPNENIHLSEMKRQAVKAAFKADPSSYQRYVEGKFARVYRGKKVTPEYKPSTHLSKYPLKPVEGLIGFRGWDGWSNPSCTLGQVSHTGRVIFIDVLRSENTDIRTFIEVQVKPLLESPRWKGKCKAWRDMGDISMKQPDQSNINESAARVIEQKFGTYFEGGPKLWDTIRRRMKYSLNKNIGGEAAIIINCEATLLDRTLDGGWHYPTDTSGNIIRDIPVKDSFSHIGDCFGNVVSILLPMEDQVINLEKYKKVLIRTRQRAATYA